MQDLFVCARVYDLYLTLSLLQELRNETVSLMIWNLGFLPGATTNKNTTKTEAATTLNSISNAVPLIAKGGALSISLYPGHSGGDAEAAAIENALSDTNFWLKAGSQPQEWRVMRHRNLVNEKAPYLVVASRLFQ
mmetsp:Transcript_22411/g.36109  ORF Transcript_22411/g.36109 Transcript_22411/m.36109 type:complete len:135 (+) Transcript_22411:116-520(+)